MREVDDEDQLDEDEEESADEADVHPNLSEGAVGGDEEGADHGRDYHQVLDAPEPVLDPGPGVVGAADPDHEQGHEQEEQRHDEAHPGRKREKMMITMLDAVYHNGSWHEDRPVHGQVSDKDVAVDGGVFGCRSCQGCQE